MHIIKKKILYIMEMIKKPEMEILPGHLAFSLVISIAPIVTLLVLIASSLSLSAEVFVNFMLKAFPKEVSELLIPFTKGTGFDINLGISLMVGLLIASNGLYCVVTTSNTLYKKEKLTTFKRRIKSLVLTMLLVFLFLFLLIVLAFGNKIIRLILTLVMEQKVITLFYQLFVFLKWPIGFLAIFFTINIIYALAPDSPIPSRYTRKGALFTTVAWTLVTAIYSYYVNTMARYDLFYGSLSNIIIMMIWVYILSYIFVLGIAFNAERYKLGTFSYKDKA